MAELGVDRHCRELAGQGYTMIEHLNPELSARMRAYHLAREAVKLTGTPVGYVYVQVVLVGADVFTVGTSGTLARPAPAAILAALIAQVQGG